MSIGNGHECTRCVDDLRSVAIPVETELSVGGTRHLKIQADLEALLGPAVKEHAQPWQTEVDAHHTYSNEEANRSKCKDYRYPFRVFAGFLQLRMRVPSERRYTLGRLMLHRGFAQHGYNRRFFRTGGGCARIRTRLV